MHINFQAFQAFDRQRWRADLAAKNAPAEHIYGNVRRVE